MSDNFYEVLWVTKGATQDEIKKAYRKKAMQFHPDRNKWDKNAENEFKKINQAYDVLSDESKRKNYDMFWSAWNNYSSSNPFWWAYWWGFSDIEDLFSNFSSWSSRNKYTSQWFDFWDLFWNFNNKKSSNQDNYQKQESIDIEKTYEIPIFDLILWCKIEVEWFLWEKAKLNIPEFTKHWTKFRVKWFWKNIWGKKWNLIVVIDSKMPKNISDLDKNLLKTIRENIGY